MSLKDEKCRFCGSVELVGMYETSSIQNASYQLAHCKRCSAISLTPAPSDDELARAYAEDYYGERKSKFGPFIENVLNYFRSARARRLKSLLPSGKVLDIGCGNGLFLRQLEKMGSFTVYGTEMEGGSAERAKVFLDANLEIGALNERTFYNHTFNAIVLNHVFEHLSDPKYTLDWIDLRIEKNGIVCIALPNIESWQSKFFKGHWLHLDPPRHLVYLSFEGLKNEMTKRGYEVVKTQFFNLEYNPFGAVQSWMNWMGFKRELLYEALKGNEKYIRNDRISVTVQKLIYPVLMAVFVPIDCIASFFKKSATMEVYFRKK